MLELPSRTVIGVGLLVLGLIFVLYMMGAIEAFQEKEDAAKPPAEVAAEAAAEVPAEADNAVHDGPREEDIASAQDNSIKPAEQAVASTGGPVSPAESSTVVTAPGVVRPAGAGSVRPSFPAAAGLDGLEGGPFESYVKMLVKSELAGLGVAEAAAEPFVANEEGAIGNATGYVKKAWQGIFGKPVDVRIA